MPEIMVDTPAFFSAGLQARADALREQQDKTAAVDVQRGNLKLSAEKAKADQAKMLKDQVDKNLDMLYKASDFALKNSANSAEAQKRSAQIGSQMLELLNNAVNAGVYDPTEARSVANAYKAAMSVVPTQADMGVAEATKAVNKADAITGAYGIGNPMAAAGMAGVPDQYEVTGTGPKGQTIQTNRMTGQQSGASGTGSGGGTDVNITLTPEGGIPLDKTAEGAAQKELILNIQPAKQRLKALYDKYDPKFLTVMGKFKGGVLELADQIGGKDAIDALGRVIGEKDAAKFYADKSAFERDVMSNVNMTLRAISGAAMTEAEAVRIMGQVPNMKDGSEKFKAKRDALADALNAAEEYYRQALTRGIVTEDFNSLMRDQAIEAAATGEFTPPIDLDEYDKRNGFKMPGTPDQTKAALDQRPRKRYNLKTDRVE